MSGHEQDPMDAPATDATESAHAEPRSLSHDTAYSPGSETETQQKQNEHVSGEVDDDIDRSQVKVAPGTGGPDDVGEVEVDPEDLNMP